MYETFYEPTEQDLKDYAQHCREEKTMSYLVVNLNTDEEHGVFETLDEARGCVLYDRLTRYCIYSGAWDGEEFTGGHRVENCDPYDGDDDRAKQGLGLI